MAGLGSHSPEVVGCAHDARSEMPLPEAVGQHSSGQGMVGAAQPQGQLGPGPRNRQLRGRLLQVHSVGQDARKPRFHLLQVFPQVAPIQDVDRRHQLGLAVAHDHRLGNVEQRVVMGLVGGFGGRHLQHGVPQLFHELLALDLFLRGQVLFQVQKGQSVRVAQLLQGLGQGGGQLFLLQGAIVVRNFEGLHHLRRKLRLLGFEHAPADFLLQQSVRPAELGQGQEAGVGLGPVKHGKLGDHRNFHGVAARKDGLEAVVVLLGEGIELVVVTAGAAQREPHECRGGGVDPVGQDFIELPAGVHLGFARLRHQPVEPCAHPGLQRPQLLHRDGVAPFQIQVVGPEFVCRDLLLKEAVEGLVFVEGLDDVVPVAPGMGKEGIGFKSGRVGVANHVQPVPSPAFPVVGRGQQFVHHRLEGPGRVVLEEAFHLFRRGGKADQVEVGAPNQRALVGGRGRGQAFLPELGQHEGVDRVPLPLLAAHPWHRGAPRLAERPPVGLLRGGVGVAAAVFPDGARVDPLPDEVQLLLGQAR